MFQHDTRLDHLLLPHHYVAPQHYQKELTQVFEPSWQFVCTASELAQPGDFQTFELFGVPLLIRNFDGEFRAFVNICPHRHSLLTCQASGNSETLKCQYHGWQFKKDGTTGKIPEPKAFRPWDRENARLESVRLEQCGDLLFATLDSELVPLKEFLAPYFDQIATRFDGTRWRMAETWEFGAQCNWKVVIENTLESYHVAEVHPTWMGGQLPAEENTQHTLGERYTTLKYLNPSVDRDHAVEVCHKFNEPPIHGYWHWHIHPNLVFVSTDTFNYFATTIPTGPTTSRVRVRMYPLWPRTRNPWNLLVREVAWRIARRLIKQVFNEDRTIFDAQQKGISSSRHRGVIGVREERIFQFQDYILRRTGLSVEDVSCNSNDYASQSQHCEHSFKK